MNKKVIGVVDHSPRERRSKVYSEHSTIGLTFLNKHDKMSAEKGVDDEHVIVDRQDYHMLIQYLTETGITAQDIIEYVNLQKRDPNAIN